MNSLIEHRSQEFQHGMFFSGISSRYPNKLTMIMSNLLSIKFISFTYSQIHLNEEPIMVRSEFLYCILVFITSPQQLHQPLFRDTQHSCFPLELYFALSVPKGENGAVVDEAHGFWVISAAESILFYSGDYSSFTHNAIQLVVIRNVGMTSETEDSRIFYHWLAMVIEFACYGRRNQRGRTGLEKKIEKSSMILGPYQFDRIISESNQVIQ
ncbi:hypothetical protein GGU10DRAFT_369223 [Lentinula aff. detonsa]|uniref:Uncharacterized protein n=1 Tax=Lentinula aff. detonsa TaxID=2804958 RepID=A0AA38NHG7_9AGAR|nr:hypothetical protein GGU10DRAFT_369223 [Lentinula aff. detonsa]